MPLAVFEPENEEQCALILELARREGKTVRAAGIGHSPSDLACTTGFMLRTEKLCKIIEVNSEKHYVVAQAGITLNALHAELDAHGLAMINVGSISDQTLGGVVTTASHGSGITYPVLSNHVLSLTLLLADGSRVRCSRQEHSDLFLASICGLGSTGLILDVTLDVEPAFRLKEVQQSLEFDDVVRNLDSLVHAAQHVRFWWFPQAGVLRVSSADRTAEPKHTVDTWLWHSLVGYHLIQFLLFLGRYATSLNSWICIFTAWLDRGKTVAVDDSHRIFNLDCKFPHFTTEWAIPYDNARACLRELRAWLDEEQADPSGLRPHFPIEVRFTEADDIWLSPSNGQRTCWIGIIQYKPYGLNVPYRKLFARFEDILARHGGKPHWAKAHRLRPDALRRLYPRFDDFVRVLEDVDPHGMFRNEYVQRHVFGKQGPEYDERVFKRLQ
ncbi:L-gulonolactone oxidase [Grifola frondosa]|uniref:D-arabinono-1,4-lactone oxidase n=1 Tax=Grifola frondosa TaxID=5627 RepID=A0A1C7MBM7_GRIFR|nr:L-gulonolactone oxidase [Grifola frondosa]